MLFKEIERPIWRDASVRAVRFHDRIEINGNFRVFDQMLEIRVTAVLTDHRFAS